LQNLLAEAGQLVDGACCNASCVDVSML
jgi:hypothetical protein